jgi:hypothetical protein
MATPTDQTNRNRHPEDYGRPDDCNAETMRIWTGIGAPANEYEWNRNPTTGYKSAPGTPVSRPTEKARRPPEITEYVPPHQSQRDPWSLTSARKAVSVEVQPRKATSPAPVSTHPIVEFRPLRQKQKDPWSLSRVMPVNTEYVDPTVLRDVETSDHPIVEFVPEPQQQKDPWSLTESQRRDVEAGNPVVLDKVDVSYHPIVEFTPDPQIQREPWNLVKSTMILGENLIATIPISDAPVSEVPIVEYTPPKQKQVDPWSLTKPQQAISTRGSTATAVPKTR